MTQTPVAVPTNMCAHTNIIEKVYIKMMMKKNKKKKKKRKNNQFIMTYYYKWPRCLFEGQVGGVWISIVINHSRS